MFDVADVQTSTARSKSGRCLPGRRALRYRYRLVIRVPVVCIPHRSATGQGVETMEQLTDASRQVSTTGKQIAAAAGTLADLAGNLEATAATTRERY
jgi:hypothetical protein